LIYDVAYGTLRLIRRSLSYPVGLGADLNLAVGCPKPEASVFYTKACTMLGPLDWWMQCDWRTDNRAV